MNLTVERGEPDPDRPRLEVRAWSLLLDEVRG